FVALSRNDDRLRMQNLFVLAELLYEFFDPVFVKKRFLFRRRTALVSEIDFNARIQERQLAQTRGQTLKLELGRDREDLRVGHEGDQRPGGLLPFDFADDFELLRRFSPGKSHVVNLAVARNLHLEPLRKRVRTFRADTVQTAGIFVSALSEFAASV